VEGFIVNETNGAWSTARTIAALSALNRGGDAEVAAISCATATNCAAAGTYLSDSSATSYRAFVADRAGGSWGTALEIPGLHRLAHGDAFVESISCGAVGNCAVGGYYSGTPDYPQHSFISNESGGRWGAAADVPGVAAWSIPSINVGVTSLSCPSANHCTAVGEYQPTSEPPAGKSFVTTEPGTPSYCSPSTGLTGAGLTAAVTGFRMSKGDFVFRITYTNRSPAVCMLTGIPNAIGYSTSLHASVGMPAIRSPMVGRGGVLYLEPISGSVETTYVIRESTALQPADCRPEPINEVLIHPKGVPQLLVPLHVPKETSALVCQGLRNEAIFGFSNR
jgi:hypothetical protein